MRTILIILCNIISQFKHEFLIGEVSDLPFDENGVDPCSEVFGRQLEGLRELLVNLLQSVISQLRLGVVRYGHEHHAPLVAEH